ncbi:MAG: 2-phosphosulfolactate phosphatase [Acidimicrobiales bacterium]
MSDDAPCRYLPSHEVADVGGPVVVIDVIRAFTTAAYAFEAGARHIYLVDAVVEALAFKAAHPGTIAMGEDHGLRPEGFDLSNSPVGAATADLEERTIVHRTSAGTRGVVAARSADRIWCASLVCASATARAVVASRAGAVTYVITGDFADRADRPGADDQMTAEHIEALRLGGSPDPGEVARRVAASEEAVRTLKLGEGHVHPDDIAYATDVDRFAFTMEVTRTADGLRLDRVDPI